MFSELSISTSVNDKGEVFINLSELCFHLIGCIVAMTEEVQNGVSNGTISDEIHTFYNGQISAMNSLGAFLAEGGLIESFNAELDNV